ncbi:MAG: YhcH/YjgK/YiaL family protein [Spirochaetales bacterium]|nr:YhcH/YjgK/YiaL family protein [Spirochaetales bacterium]
MIYGNIAASQAMYPVPDVLRRALSYIAATDFDALEFGVYEPDVDFSVQVLDVTTQDPRHTRAEVHRRNIDIHFSITGEETVYARVSPTEHRVTEDCFDDRDIGFYDRVDGEVEIPLGPGDFVVFFPGEIHRPGCRTGSAATIKKIVVKIEAARVVSH